MATYSFINNPNPRQQIVRGDQPNKYWRKDEALPNSTIEDEGTPLTQRDTINFVGDGVEATDDGTKTVVTIVKQITVSATAPSNPQLHDLWLDIS